MFVTEKDSVKFNQEELIAVNLINGERDMLATEKNPVKFNQEELIAIQEFNEELKHRRKAYELIVGKIHHEFSIENENLVKIHVCHVISQIFLLQNEDKNQREFLTKIIVEDEDYSLDYPDKVYGEIKEALNAVLVAHDEDLKDLFWGLSIIVKKFDRTDRERIDEFSRQLARYIKPYKLISITSKSRDIEERKLNLELKQNHNQLSIQNSQLSIDLTLTADKTTFAGDKIYTVKHRLTSEDEFDETSDDYQIIYHQKIEEALKQMFSLLKTHLNKVLELPTYFVKKVEDDESVNNDF